MASMNLIKVPMNFNIWKMNKWEKILYFVEKYWKPKTIKKVLNLLSKTEIKIMCYYENIYLFAIAGTA